MACGELMLCLGCIVISWSDHLGWVESGSKIFELPTLYGCDGSVTYAGGHHSQVCFKLLTSKPHWSLWTPHHHGNVVTMLLHILPRNLKHRLKGRHKWTYHTQLQTIRGDLKAYWKPRQDLANTLQVLANVYVVIQFEGSLTEKIYLNATLLTSLTLRLSDLFGF